MENHGDELICHPGGWRADRRSCLAGAGRAFSFSLLCCVPQFDLFLGLLEDEIKITHEKHMTFREPQTLLNQYLRIRSPFSSY